MNYELYFWKASLKELKRGWFREKNTDKYICLVCGKVFKRGVIHAVKGNMLTAKKAVAEHILDEHKSMFEFFLDMGKVYTGLTEHQRALMLMFYQGLSDKDIVSITEATSTSTIRNQRFVFKEKYKQAKIITAMYELLEERKDSMKPDSIPVNKARDDEIIEIHKAATQIDERYSITESEKRDLLKRYFDKDNRLLIKNFPAKEKKKIIILQHITEEFEAAKRYKEKEVNGIIGLFYEDIPTIRRYLVEYGFLDRKSDGSEYWVKQ